MDDDDIPGETAAEKIEFLRTAAARCRRLSNATGDYELNETLIALADEYEAKIGELGGLGPLNWRRISGLSAWRLSSRGDEHWLAPYAGNRG